jgi:nucleotidyltransferase/DNA polymerase involved in DNA repair
LLAELIQETIRTRLGLVCSVGVAQSKLVAKIASDFKKTAGLTVVEPAGTQGVLAQLTVRKIPGIGKKAELALFELGIRTIGDLAAYDIRKFVAEFGGAPHYTKQPLELTEVK